MAEPISIDLPGTFVLRQNRLERLIRLLQPLFVLDEPAVIVLDLSRLVSISPSGLALLAAALRRLIDNELMSGGSRIIAPHHPGVRTYLQRMNLLRSLPEFDRIEEDFERHDERGFRGCRAFTSDEYAATAREMTEAVAERCTMDQVAGAAVRVCLDEMAENVGHHSEARLGFAAAQGWRRSSELEVAIVDLGVGIRASLTKNPEYKNVTDDAEAIQTALQPRVSATPERNAGIGLFVTRMLLKANGGSMIVRSGLGAVYSGAVERVERSDINLPGTLVAIRARTDNPLDVNSVYAQLGPIDDD